MLKITAKTYFELGPDMLNYIYIISFWKCKYISADTSAVVDREIATWSLLMLFCGGRNASSLYL